MLRHFKLFTAALLLVSNFSITKAQEGYPYISNFERYEPALRQILCIQEGRSNVMFFGTRRGVYFYDSQDWKLVANTPITKALALDTISGKILVGGNKDLGYIEKDSKGNYNYFSFVNKELIIGDFTKVCVIGGNAWFYSEDNLIEVSLKNNQILLQKKAALRNPFQGMLVTDDKLFLNTRENGLVEVQDSGFKLPGIKSLIREKILFSLHLDDQKYLLGCENGSLFVFNSNSLSRYSISDSTYLHESILQGGVEVNNTITLSTLLGGCIIIDKKNGKTINIVNNNSSNNNSGLPDDEILAIGKDRNSGVWLAHSFGLSRVALKFPVRTFSNYPGIKGTTMNSSIEFENNIYISTNDGVFYLSKKEEYTAHEIIEKHTITPKQPAKKDQANTTSEQAPPKKKPGFFARLFGGSKSEETKKNEEQVNPEIEILKKKIYSLQSTNYSYIKVEGLSGKCRQMLALGDRILVATNSGLYEIINHKAKSVLKDKYINFIKISKNNKKLYAGTKEGVQSFTLNNGSWKTLHFFTKPEVNERIWSMDELKENELWFGGESFIYRITVDETDKPVAPVKSFSTLTEYDEPIYLKFINSELYVFLSDGIYKFSDKSLSLFLPSHPDSFGFPSYFYSNGPVVWAHINNEWQIFADTGFYKDSQKYYLNLFDDPKDLHLDKSGKLWVVDEKNQLTRILSSSELENNYEFELFARSINNNKKEPFNIEKFEVDQASSSLHFEMAAPFYLKNKGVFYRYKIDNLIPDWTEWSTESKVSENSFSPGVYVLHVQAKNILGNISKEKSIRFTVKPPWYKAWWAIALYVISAISLIYLFIKGRIAQLEADKRILEQKVQERTVEIQHQKEEIEQQRDVLAVRNEEVMHQKEEIEAQRDDLTLQNEEILLQKEEIETQRDEIEAQRDELENQNAQIALQNKEITDSIVYAKRIQTAVMPTESEILQIMPDGFIYFRPRDIVSGDFYWASQRKNKIIIVAADCTGHGVPGAFMSMLGISFLNEIVNEQEFPSAAEILNELRQNVLNTLSQKVENVDMQDGMDIALAIIDKQEMQVEFAGAFNPMILIRNGEIHEVPGDRMPIGSHVFERENFKNNVIKIFKNDAIYLFSDGYVSQFGGTEDRKFNSKAFRQLLLNVHAKPMLEQKQIIDTTMINWKGEKEQMDDILVIGVRV